MSSLKNINHSPKFTSYLVSRDYFRDEPFLLVDVGARGGLESHWRVFDDQIIGVGFEPDVKECNKLNKIYKKNFKFYPHALWENETTRKFYMMRNPSSSSFFVPIVDFWKRFPDDKNLTIKKTVKLKTISLDLFTTLAQIEYIDFIKMDAEGAELAILKGAKNSLSKSVLGLSLEVLFGQRSYDQPTFSEIDLYLKNFGFDLFDLGLYRLGRRTLFKNPGPKDHGQVILGHALYLKDPLKSSSKGLKFWDIKKLLKLASIMEIFGLNDCALEVIAVARENRLILGLDYQHFIKLLQPQNSLFNRVMRYII